MNKKIGIIGFGEIGSSLYKVYREHEVYADSIFVVDPAQNYNEDLTGVYILNICIPFIENFVDIVNDYIDKFNPELTVIHSTVAPGTTAKIKGKACHSPVRGLHPNLDTGIKTFLKYIGSEDKEVAEEYSNHLEGLGISTVVCKNSKTTEYAKLLDTTYYGVCIAFHNDVNRICEEEGLDFDEVMTTYNHSYNEGYTQLGKKNVVRPVLYASNKIGGHCVVPNAKILKDYLSTELIQAILKYE